MSVQEYYQKMEGDYKSAFARLGSDERLIRFLVKFVDKDEWSSLMAALDKDEWQEAFLHAHNMKGFALNLSLTALAKSSSELCEALRHGEPSEDIRPMVSAVQSSYEKITEAVEQLRPVG